MDEPAADPADARPARSTSVFLVGVGVNAHGFAAFCRHHLLDFAGAGTELRTFLLRRPVDTAPLPEVDHLFGRWPAEFSSSYDLRDTLVEAVSDHLENVGDGEGVVSIVAVANQPSDLLAGDLFAPIRAELAAGRLRSSQLWTVAALMSGPGFQEEEVAQLVSLQLGGRASAGMFLNVFLLGEEVGQAGFDLGERHARPLRFLIDLVRNDRVGWSRARQRAQTGRVLWFGPGAAGGRLRSDDLLGYLKGAMDALTRRSRDDGEAQAFRAEVASQLAVLQPETGTAAAEDYKDYPSLPAKRNFRHAAIEALLDFVKPGGFPTHARKAYDRLLEQTRQFVGQEEANHERKAREMEARWRARALPNAGLSESARLVVGAEVERVEAAQLGWESAARGERNTFFREHQHLQAKPDPSSTGRLAFDLVAGAREFPPAVEAAARAAGDLPANRISLILLGLLGPALLLLATALHLLSVSGGLQLDPPADSNWGTPRILAFGAGLILVAGLPPLLVLLWRLSYLKAQREAFAHLRHVADEIRRFILNAMDGARGYSLKTSAALLNRELARVLGGRLRGEPLLILGRQQRAFFDGLVKPTQLDAQEQAEIARLVSAEQEPKLLLRNLVRHWLGREQPEDAAKRAWHLRIVAQTAAQGFRVEADASLDTQLTIPSGWTSGPQEVELVPVAWRPEPPVTTPRPPRKRSRPRAR